MPEYTDEDSATELNTTYLTFGKTIYRELEEVGDPEDVGFTINAYVVDNPKLLVWAVKSTDGTYFLWSEELVEGVNIEIGTFEIAIDYVDNVTSAILRVTNPLIIIDYETYE